MNSINLIGRLVRDPEVKYTKGKEPLPYCNFTLAVGRNKEKTDFIDCVAFAGTAEMLEKHFMKGMLVGATGSLQVDSYEDKEGNRRKSFSVIVRTITFCDSGQPEDDEPEEDDPEEMPTERRRNGGKGRF